MLIGIDGAHAAVRNQDILTVGMVGAVAKFSFFDETWDGLGKTAVFRQGNVTKDAALYNDEATIPWEVLQMPGIPVQIGVYGTNKDGSVVIPTVWAATRPVRDGTDPSGDESADPSLPLWAQMQEQIAALREQVQPDVKIASVSLLAAKWTGEGSLYSQVVSIAGITPNSQVNLTPSVEQLSIFYEKDLTFITENDGGVVTVYVIGQKPQNDYIIQADVVEVTLHE